MHFKNREPIQGYCQPKRCKLALLTFVGLLAPVYFIPPALSAMLSGPRLVSVSATVFVIVVLMTYVIMPTLMRLTASWLCKKSKQKI